MLKKYFDILLYLNLIFVLRMGKKVIIKEGKKMLLENVPIEVQKLLVERQDDEKELCDCERSQEYALYKIVREHASVFNKKMPVVLINGQFVESELFNIHHLPGFITLSVTIPDHTSAGMAITHLKNKGVAHDR